MNSAMLSNRLLFDDQKREELDELTHMS